MKAIINLDLTTNDNKTFRYVIETNNEDATLDVRGLEIEGISFRPVFEERLPLDKNLPLDITKVSTAVAFALSRHTLGRAL